MRKFEYTDARSHKFWNIDLQGDRFTVTFGRIGTAGQTQLKTFADAEKASQAHDKLIQEKMSKGYVEMAPALPAATNTREALERALIEDRDEIAALHAYADYLAEQNDPALAARGEFIAVQLALEDEKRSAEERKQLQQREAELLKAHEREWLGSLAPYLLDGEGLDEWQRSLEQYRNQHRFRRGWFDALRIYRLSAPLARAIGTAPRLEMLSSLTVIEQDYDEPGIEELARVPLPSNLRSFQLGPVDDSCHMDGELAIQFVRKFPRLEELRLCAHRVPVRVLFEMNLPTLRTLYIYHIHEYPLEVLAANRSLSNLEELALWPHGLEPGDDAAYITFEGVRALVHSPHLPKLAHLQIRLSDLGDRGCEEIVRSGILKRLRSLDLRGGCVTDAGARTLAACPDLKRLERVEIGNNWLSPAGVAVLQKVGIHVEAKDQFENDGEDREYLAYGDPE
jgi:uncharacterized protein (TIGR02996 family)